MELKKVVRFDRDIDELIADEYYTAILTVMIENSLTAEYAAKEFSGWREVDEVNIYVDPKDLLDYLKRNDVE